MEENKQYETGFNKGYILAKHEPVLYADLCKSVETINDYFDGFTRGGRQYEIELQKSQEKGHDKEHKKDKGFDKGR